MQRGLGCCGVEAARALRPQYNTFHTMKSSPSMSQQHSTEGFITALRRPTLGLYKAFASHRRPSYQGFPRKLACKIWGESLIQLAAASRRSRLGMFDQQQEEDGKDQLGWVSTRGTGACSAGDQRSIDTGK